MNVLIIGGGGREHALAWKIAKSPNVKKIVAVPGNPGIAQVGHCINMSINDWNGIKKVIYDRNIDIVIVGPEAPLVQGIGNRIKNEGILFFGPSAAAAKLEGSKAFSKEFCRKYGIPTADFDICTSPDEVIRAARKRQFKCAVKADGLAAGKGVYICYDKGDVENAVEIMMTQKKFGSAGDKVVIEDLLVGSETSIMVVTDGEDYYMLAPSQDHKRLMDQDRGPNTGGMGAFSPASIVTETIKTDIENRIIRPTLKGMQSENRRFTGLLYVGIMIVDEHPFVLEFNVRFGDPETQPVLMRLKSDLFELLWSASEGHIGRAEPPVWHPESSVCVVVASSGYPGKYNIGFPINGLDGINESEHIEVFHAGTKWDHDRLVTAGGRVLGVTALGKDIEDARQKVYNAIEHISFEKMYFRRDIGWRR